MKRYLSLDILRGITVAFMCVVNNPGSWGKIFAPLRHAPWSGCTPTDLVYPFFIFCMGVAMAFSFRKYDGLHKDGVKKVIYRGLALFGIGFLIGAYPFFPTSPHDPAASFGENWLYWIGHRRIFGVLQRIGMAYLIAGLLALWLRKPGKIMVAIVILMTIHTAVLVAFGDAGSPFSLEGNISGRIDTALVGSQHVYHGYRLDSGARADFDPEGLLGSLTAACSALLGYLVGFLICTADKRHAENPSDTTCAPSFTVSRIFVYGAAALALSQVLSIWIPVNKPLWTASYVFYAGGWAMLSLALLIFVVDIRGYGKVFKPFSIMGTNALAAFVLSAVIVKTYSMFGFRPSAWFGANEYLSLCWALIFATTIFLCQWLMYKKNIIIKL